MCDEKQFRTKSFRQKSEKIIDFDFYSKKGFCSKSISGHIENKFQNPVFFENCFYSVKCEHPRTLRNL